MENHKSNGRRNPGLKWKVLIPAEIQLDTRCISMATVDKKRWRRVFFVMNMAKGKRATNIMTLIDKDSLFFYFFYIRKRMRRWNIKYRKKYVQAQEGLSLTFYLASLAHFEQREKNTTQNVTHDNRYLTNFTFEEKLKQSQTLSLYLFLTMPNIWCGWSWSSTASFFVALSNTCYSMTPFDL